MTLLLPIQLGLLLFIVFAATRAIARFRGGSLHLGSLAFWLCVWAAATLAVFFPNETTSIAQMVGISRGVDVIVYSSIALLFYLVFRAYIYIEDLRTQISTLIRELALRDVKKKTK